VPTLQPENPLIYSNALEGRRIPRMERLAQTHKAERYRRYRIIGLLPALIILAGGLYLGVAEGNWIPLLAGLLFLLVCTGMIASDRTGKASKKRTT
jgi:hypothetical protein